MPGPRGPVVAPNSCPRWRSRSPTSSDSSVGNGPLPTRVDDLPPLPPAYQRALDDGLAVLGLVLESSARRAIDRMVFDLLGPSDEFFFMQFASVPDLLQG